MNRYDKEAKRVKEEFEVLKDVVNAYFQILDKPPTKETIIHLMERCYSIGHNVGHLSAEKWAEVHYKSMCKDGELL